MSTRNLALEALRSVFDRPDTAESYDAMMMAVQAAIAALEAETGEPYAWTVSASGRMWRGKFAEHDALIEAKHCGGTCEAFPLYTAPIPAVPVAWCGVSKSTLPIYRGDE